MRAWCLALIVLIAPLSMMSTSSNNQFELNEPVNWQTSSVSSALVNVSVSNSAGYFLSTAFWHACSASNLSYHLTCWGKNSAGQHGIGTSNAINTPVESLSLNGPIIDLDSGSSGSYSGFTCAVNSMNELYCWGSNTKGQLGVGDETPSTTPARVYLDSSWVRLRCLLDLTMLVPSQRMVLFSVGVGATMAASGMEAVQTVLPPLPPLRSEQAEPQ